MHLYLPILGIDEDTFERLASAGLFHIWRGDTQPNGDPGFVSSTSGSPTLSALTCGTLACHRISTVAGFFLNPINQQRT